MNKNTHHLRRYCREKCVTVQRQQCDPVTRQECEQVAREECR